MAAVSVMYRAASALALLAVACSGSPDRVDEPAPGRPGHPPPPARHARVTLAVVGTSDLHGHIEMLPYLAGSLANLRASGSVDDVILLDGGDMFQGTLESNLNEGKSVVEAYQRLGYTAVAVGNHEFDFGPVGERAVPIEPHDDPRGALKARTAEARYPFLAANLIDGFAREPASWPNLHQAVLIERAGVTIGIIGVATMDTPRTTNARNFDGLVMAPIVKSIAEQAAALRKRGARLVLVTAHAGGRCTAFDDPRDLSPCDPAQEIFEVARALPPGAVDAIVAGHTHAGIAHEVSGIPIVQSFSKGIAFGRIDLTIEGDRVSHRIHRPQFLCGERREPPDLVKGETCAAGEYEGKPVQPDKDLSALVARYEAQARTVRERTLGIVSDGVIHGVYNEESPLGNLFADLMRAARPDADVALTNGGGLRADLPEGELTYGDLYEAMPFDNRFATIKLTGAQLARVFEHNLSGAAGVFNFSGVRVIARCSGSELVVTLTREKGGKAGKRVAPRERLTMVTSDFLASGGDNILGVSDLDQGAIQIDDQGPMIRDGIAEVLARRGGTLHARDRRLYDKAAPRFVYPGKRPVRCGAAR